MGIHRPVKNYNDIKKKYCGFVYPMLTLQIGDKIFGENNSGLIISEISVELSCGSEASVASFSIYGVYNLEEGQYLFSKFKDRKSVV